MYIHVHTLTRTTFITVTVLSLLLPTKPEYMVTDDKLQLLLGKNVTTHFYTLHTLHVSSFAN